MLNKISKWKISLNHQSIEKLHFAGIEFIYNNFKFYFFTSEWTEPIKLLALQAFMLLFPLNNVLLLIILYVFLNFYLTQILYFMYIYSYNVKCANITAIGVS